MDRIWSRFPLDVRLRVLSEQYTRPTACGLTDADGFCPLGRALRVAGLNKHGAWDRNLPDMPTAPATAKCLIQLGLAKEEDRRAIVEEAHEFIESYSVFDARGRNVVCADFRERIVSGDELKTILDFTLTQVARDFEQRS